MHAKYRRAIKHFGHESLTKVHELNKLIDKELEAAKALKTEGYILQALTMVKDKDKKALLMDQWELVSADQVQESQVQPCLLQAMKGFVSQLSAAASKPTAKRSKA